MIYMLTRNVTWFAASDCKWVMTVSRFLQVNIIWVEVRTKENAMISAVITVKGEISAYYSFQDWMGWTD